MDRPISKLLGISLLAITGATGCSGDEGCTPGNAVRLATFNGGLALGDIDYVDQRVGPATQALASQHTEVLCVQEFWSHWSDLTSAATALPNRVRREPMANCPEPMCTDALFTPAETCALEHCSDVRGDAFLACAYDESTCKAEIDAILAESPGCVDCITQNAALDIPGIRDACVGGGSSGEASFLYQCQYDTGILTNATITDQESRELDTYLIKAAVDFARIQTDSGELDVFCTHLASEMSSDPGDHGSWKDLQAAQIDQVLAFVSEKNDGSRPAVLMGDLNTGPSIAAAGITGEWPDHYDRLISAGFDNPYTVQADVDCTLCPDNTFRSDTSDGRLIDHILLKNPSSDASCSRIMTETTSIDPGDGPIDSSYSDHYGLQLELAGWCGE